MSDDIHLRLKRHYSILAHSTNVVELRHGAWNALSFTLADEQESGKLLGVLSRLDGKSSIGEIATAEQMPKTDVEALVDQLSDLGLLETDAEHVLDYYVEHIIPNLLPYGREKDVPEASVVLFGERQVADEIARVLRSSAPQNEYEVVDGDDGLRNMLLRGATSWASDGLRFEEEAEAFASWRDRLVVFASSTPNPLELRAFNLVSLKHRIPWIHAAVDGPFILIGPTIVPWRSACYECLETRVLMNLREAASYVGYKRVLAEGRALRATKPLDAVLQAMLASLTAFEALNFLLTGASFTIGKLLAVYLPTMEFVFNEVLRLPGCSACAPSPEGDDTELYFELRTLLDVRPPSGGSDET